MSSSLLAKINSLKPEDKNGQLREVIPAIQLKIQEGVRLSTILKLLHEEGINISENTLKVYLYRYRKSRKSNALIEKSAINHVEEKPAQTAEKNQLSVQEFQKLLRPDPEEQAKKIAEYERIARENLRKQKHENSSN